MPVRERNDPNNRRHVRRRNKNVTNMDVNGIGLMFQEMMRSYNRRAVREAHRQSRARGRDDSPQRSAARRVSSETQRIREAEAARQVGSESQRRREIQGVQQQSRDRARTHDLARPNRPSETRVMGARIRNTIEINRSRQRAVATCGICMQALVSSAISACSLRHRYHQNCIDRWLMQQLGSGLNGTCPSCRTVMVRASR